MSFLLQVRGEIEMHGTIARASSAVRMAVLCMVLAGASFGCGAQRERAPFVDPGDARIRFDIQNRGWNDATVHAILGGGRRVRLGIITGKQTASFLLPVPTSVLLQLEIDVLAGPGCTTRDMWADPGDIIVLEILSVDLLSGLRYCGR